MIYLDEVNFITEKQGGYDPDLGEYLDAKRESKLIEVNVTDLGSERSIKLFGDVKESSIVVRVSPMIELPNFDFIEFNAKQYKLIRDIYPCNRTTLIFKEAQHESKSSD